MSKFGCAKLRSSENQHVALLYQCKQVNSRFARSNQSNFSGTHQPLLSLTISHVFQAVPSLSVSGGPTVCKATKLQTLWLGHVPHLSRLLHRWVTLLLAPHQRLNRRLGPLHRTTPVSSFFLRSFMIFVTAGIIQAYIIQRKLDLIPNDIDLRLKAKPCYWAPKIPVHGPSFQRPCAEPEYCTGIGLFGHIGKHGGGRMAISHANWFVDQDVTGSG